MKGLNIFLIIFNQIFSQRFDIVKNFSIIDINKKIFILTVLRIDYQLFFRSALK